MAVLGPLHAKNAQCSMQSPGLRRTNALMPMARAEDTAPQHLAAGASAPVNAGGLGCPILRQRHKACCRRSENNAFPLGKEKWKNMA